MVLRRAFFYWQSAAAVVLPLWLLIGWGIWGSSRAELFGIAFTAPVLVIALLAVVGLIFARKSVREKRAVSWLDAGTLGLWHALLVALGFFGPGANWFAVAAVVAAMVAFWAAGWQLVTETRRRVRLALDEIQRAAAPQGGPARNTVSAGEYIVLPPEKSPER